MKCNIVWYFPFRIDLRETRDTLNKGWSDLGSEFAELYNVVCAIAVQDLLCCHVVLCHASAVVSFDFMF